MGLDITAYSKAARIHKTEEWCEEDGHVRAFVYDGMEHALGELEPGYCYDVTGAEEFDFRAGSYSGYNEWRRRLCVTILGVEPEEVWSQPEMWQGSPFYELINFADNEGTIGATVAAKLSSDFSEHAQRFLDATANDVHNWDRQKYEEWHRACALAARGGLVQFR